MAVVTVEPAPNRFARTFTVPLAAIAAAWFLAVYAPAIGRGLIKDDFAWIAASVVHGPADVMRLFGANTGFYRPLVSLSFALDYAVFGLHPLGYGLTNLALLVLAAVGIARLAVALKLPPVAGLVAAAAWALNPHGINMALLWVSGRTSLLLTLFAVLAATSFVRGRTWVAASWTLLAMLCKEEAVLLPVMLLSWAILVPREDYRPDGRGRGWTGIFFRSAPLFLPLAVYGVLRFNSGAMTPASAPSFYRFLTDPRLVAVNALHYLDRTTTFPLLLALVASIATRRWPRFDARERRLLAACAAWLVGGCAITVLIPSRSSLYAVFPSVGSVLACGAWVTAVLDGERRIRTRSVVLVALALAVIGVPVYRARNHRWLSSADMSAALVTQLERIGPSLPNGCVLQIVDRSPGRTVEGVFGTLLGDALALGSHRDDVHVWLEPPANDWKLAGWQRPTADSRVVVYEFVDGRLLPAPNDR